MLRLAPGARATLDNCTFANNVVAAATADTIAAGPVIGLYGSEAAKPSADGAAAWFNNCRFVGSASALPGEAAVESRACRVYSSTRLPTVWDLGLVQEVSAWPLALQQGSERGGGDVFADVSGRGGGAFPRPSDDVFTELVTNQASAPRLPPVAFRALPNGTEYATWDPYVTLGGIGC